MTCPIPPGDGPLRTGARQPESQDVDAPLDEVAVGQFSQLLPECQGHPVVLEGLPGLPRRQCGRGAQPADSRPTSILCLLLQHLQEGGETSPCPAAVKRETGCVPIVGSRN
ncbi:MAG: hypothetical protein J4G14_15215 [Dehalococcoidia bacterium]|nr:hypothetical protein [Dehalococcoidia bacterium]